MAGENFPLASEALHSRYTHKELSFSANQSVLIDFGLLQAGKMIALFWKNMQMRSASFWLKEIATCLTLERLTYIVRGKIKQLIKIWKPFSEFLENGNPAMNVITTAAFSFLLL